MKCKMEGALATKRHLRLEVLSRFLSVAWLDPLKMNLDRKIPRGVRARWMLSTDSKRAIWNWASIRSEQRKKSKDVMIKLQGKLVKITSNKYKLKVLRSNYRRWGKSTKSWRREVQPRWKDTRPNWTSSIRICRIQQLNCSWKRVASRICKWQWTSTETNATSWSRNSRIKFRKSRCSQKTLRDTRSTSWLGHPESRDPDMLVWVFQRSKLRVNSSGKTMHGYSACSRKLRSTRILETS